MKALVCDKCQGNELAKEGNLLVCQYCGTKFVPSQADAGMFAGQQFDENTVFARWTNGFFYAGKTGETTGQHTQVFFLDGDVAHVLPHDILPIEQALQTLQFEGNWKHGGLYFKGQVVNQGGVLTMNYNDGDVEHNIQHIQLRGRKPGEKRNWLGQIKS